MQRILGIDPGLRITGYGAVSLSRGSLDPKLIEAGVIRLSGKLSMVDRLKQLHEDLTGVITELKPDTLVVEKLYSHYKHPRTAILMGHARGVILLTAAQAGIKVEHLSANEVKKAITGYGHASKEQMQRSVQMQYQLAQLPTPPDLADAIAIATCYARRVAVQNF